MIESLGRAVRGIRTGWRLVKQGGRETARRVFPWQAETRKRERRIVFCIVCLAYIAAAFLFPAGLAVIFIGLVAIGCCWTILDWIAAESRRLKVTSLADNEESPLDYSETSIDFILAAIVLVVAAPVMLNTAQSFDVSFSGQYAENATLWELSALTTEAFFASLTLDYTENFKTLEPWFEDWDVIVAAPNSEAANRLSFLVQVSFDLLIFAGLALLLRSVLAVREASRLLTLDHRPAAGLKSRMKGVLRRALASSDERRIKNAALAIQENSLNGFFHDLRKASAEAHGVKARCTCLDTLVDVYGERSVPVILQAIRDDPWAPVRVHAIEILQPLLIQYKEFAEQARTTVSKTLWHSAPTVRAAAVAFFESSGVKFDEGDPIGEKLVEMQKSEQFDIVKSALSEISLPRRDFPLTIS